MLPVVRLVGHELDFPHPLPAIASVLLEDAGTRGLQPGRESRTELGHVAIKVRVGAPAEMSGPVQDFLHTHLHDDVGMRADPRSVRGNIAQQGIKRHAGSALMDRIDPHQHPIRRRGLLTHLIAEFLGVDRGLRVDAHGVQFFEDAMETVVLRGGVPPRLHIAAPDDRDFMG